MTNALTRSTPRPAQSLSQFFDRVFGPTYSAVTGFGTQTYQGVPSNVYELGDPYQLSFLVPGIDPQSIQVTALRNAITVEGGMQLSTPEGATVVWDLRRFRRCSYAVLTRESDPAFQTAT